MRTLVTKGRLAKDDWQHATVLHATEGGKPLGRDPVDWKLIVNPSVTSRTQAIERLQW